MRDRIKRFLASLSLFVAVFVLWEVVVVVFQISELVLPRPSQVFTALIDYWSGILPHAYQTLYTTLLGFALGVICGLFLGVAIGSSRLVYDTGYPLLVGISSVPKVAVVPIFVLWFGAGSVPAILTAMIICVFPIVVNVATGIANVEPELIDVMRAMKASRREILWNVSLPRSLPYFFASLKVAITLAFVGAVVAETVASNKGIGNMMMIASSSFNVPLVFAGLLILAFLGVLLYGVFALLEQRFAGWATRRSR
ncbi:ABC transporter permease [Pelagicoccus albus]|uniref:ABC transporter permease n=1 Tax=Pelagicoccus albus TaxID=415222 RepID=A0A7X1B920_9BACT|nr:ABC transporter permease [Pelagicoccus albus]MBC2607932.1 ABC transporter permease [Pelagicoccus albus]